MTYRSFHDITIKATVNELIEAIGEPWDRSNNGQEKVNFEWKLQTKDGDEFAIYDWKEYRSISTDERIEWHIGAISLESAVSAAKQVELLLKK